MKKWYAIILSVVLSACAAYGSGGLRPGEARLEDVLRVMGEPAMRWQDADGSLQLAYPRGPEGVHTFMAYIGPDGRLLKVENVLDDAGFARIRPGMTQEEVLRTLGPSWPGWTAYFKARDELVWEWRFCDTWNELARFEVLFDGSKKTVRSTQRLSEAQMGQCGADGSCWCSR